MTDRIDFFELTVDGDPAPVAAACRLFACVSHAQVLGDGKVLGILVEPVRDEADSWGVVEAALRTLSGVDEVRTYVVSFPSFANHRFEIAQAVMEAVETARPVAPEANEHLVAFVERHRAWAAAAESFGKAAQEVVRGGDPKLAR